MNLLLALLLASSGSSWSVEPGQALVTVVKGPLAATSLDLAGEIREVDGGGIEVDLRLPAASFSAEGGRKLDRDGVVAFAGAAAAPGSDGVLHLKGTLTVRGVARPLEVPLTLVRAGGQVFCHASFSFDGARVDVDAGLRRDTAVASRG